MAEQRTFLIVLCVVIFSLIAILPFVNYEISHKSLLISTQTNIPYKLISISYSLDLDYCILHKVSDSSLFSTTSLPWSVQKLYKLTIQMFMFLNIIRLTFMLFIRNDCCNIRTIIRRFLIALFNGSRYKAINPLL